MRAVAKKKGPAWHQAGPLSRILLLRIYRSIGRRLPAEEGQRRLRAGVGLGQDRRRRGGEDLVSGQVRRLLGEIRVPDRALGGAGVFVGDAQRVDRRTDRELLERTEASTKLADLLDRLV